MRGIGLLLSLLLFAPSALPQQRATRRDSQAVDLLTRCSIAMGAPQANTTVVAIGDRLEDNAEAQPTPVVVKSSGADRLRWEVNAADRREVALVQGGTGKVVRDARVTDMAPWQWRHTRPEHFPALLCTSELQRLRMEVVYVGLEKLGATAVHHIRVSAAPQGRVARSDKIEALISEFHLFLDPATYVVLKVRRFAFSPEAIENRSEFETVYGDYRLVGGILMPFKVSNYLSGQKLWDVNFRDIRLNAGVSDGDFNP